MTPFTVDWLPGAENDLALIWLQANDKNAVTAAQDTVDRLLTQDPIRNGQHRSEGLYRIDVSPLAVFYSVDQARRIVEVSRVWYRP